MQKKVSQTTNMSYTNQKRMLIILFLFIPLSLLVAFTFYPIFKLFHLSFVEWDGIQKNVNFVFLDNYINLFKDPDTYTTLLNTGAYLLIGLLQAVIALYLAIVLNSNMKGRNFFKSLVFMPYILNGVAVAFMFNYLYDYQNGPVNIILRSIGLSEYAVRFLPDSYYINFSLGFIGLWRYTGLNMVIFIGALQSIPPSLYEAADLDGANFLHKIRYITMPSIKRVIEIVFFLNICGALQAFFEPFIITKGGPGIRSTTFTIYTLDTAFKFQNFGKASAMGVVLLLLIMMLGLLQNKVLGKRGG